MSSATLAILSLLLAVMIAGFVIWLLRPLKQRGFRRDDGAGLVHAGAQPGHTSGHYCSPVDATGHCSPDGGGGA
ncbi:MAG: hypothetical protein AB7U95_18710 [Reyranella sp.]